MRLPCFLGYALLGARHIHPLRATMSGKSMTRTG